MKKTLYSFLSLLLTFFAAQGQVEQHSQASRCATWGNFMEQVKENPAVLEQMQRSIQQSDQQVPQSAGAQRGAVRIIPVVVHVLHDCGNGNISKEQIEDGIRVLNEDFRRLNADTTATPATFRNFAADAEVEFRLAKLDPQGNCTDGIVRVESIRTNMWNPRDSLKNVSRWPSDNYLNIWLVNSIYDQNGTGGTILGYAQFPQFMATKPQTDGVVIRHDYFGTIGTAATSGNGGRVATHEVGHWLDLIHIWGDDNGACTGTDGCSDTPNQGDQVFGCPNYPVNDACNGTPAGIMFMNYMDYTDGICQNMFTTGQKNRMTNALGSWRINIHQPSNLTNTGVSGPTVTCAPKAAVCFGSAYNVCAGNAIGFKNASYNADTMTYTWYFPGAVPSVTNSKDPVVYYFTPGTYSFALVAASSAGTDSVYYTDKVIVGGSANVVPITTSYMEDFELAGSFPGDGWITNNDNWLAWQRITSTGFSGTACLKMDNFNNTRGEIDEYITPAFSFQYLNAPQMKFQRANAQRTATSNDQLNVYVSTNCGATWTSRKSLAGSALATAGVVASSFTPSNASQWALTIVNPSTGQANNVRFKFENISDGGNNTYIDDINITALTVVGIEETEFESQNFTVYPNPASGSASVTYQLATNGNVTLTLLDVTGREIRTVVSGKKELGIHLTQLDISDLAGGIYFLKLQTPNSDITTRFVVE